MRLLILFATLGYTARLCLAPLRDERFQRAFVFCGSEDTAERRSALLELRETMAAAGVVLEERKLADPFDFEQALRAYGAAHDTLPTEAKVIFNASSGPRPMIMAATLFCHVRALRLVYYDEYATRRGRDIPLQAFRKLGEIGEAKRTMLRRLQSRGPSDMSTLARTMRLAPSTVSEHVKELAAEGVVTIAREGRRRVIQLSSGVEALGVRVEK